MKIQKKKIGGVGGGGSGWGGGVRSGGGVRGRGHRVDVNEGLKFLGKFTKKNSGRGGRGGREGRGVRWGGRGDGVVRVDVNAMLGVGGDVGYDGYEPRIEGIVQCTKRYCAILRK